MLKVGVKQLSIKTLPIALPANHRPVAIVTLKNRALSPVAQLFIEHAHRRQGDGPRLMVARSHSPKPDDLANPVAVAQIATERQPTVSLGTRSAFFE